MPHNIPHILSPQGSVRGGSRSMARLHAVAAALLLCGSLTQPTPAQALAMGRVSVQSALGEPLLAEIDIPEISAEEAASLRVRVAPADAFRTAGMTFNPVLAELQVSLQRRAGGRQYVRLSSSRPVNEPFIDMVLEVSWASGRILRDYTLLFDPTNLQPPVPAPLTPAVSAPTAPPARPVQVAPQGSLATPAGAPASTPEKAQVVSVRPGDTAGRIAARHLPAQTSLDQMLLALLRSNPDAFIRGNVNRLKAGAILQLPSATDVASVPAEEARQVIAAQSRDFQAFRRQLASRAPAAVVETADRTATGRVQADVVEPAATGSSQDRLTLSKGAVAEQARTEDAIATARQRQDTAEREAALSRNIEALSQLDKGAAPSATASGDSPGTGIAVPGPVASPAADSATSPATDAASTAPPAGGRIAQLMDHPMVLPAAGVLLALLAAMGIYRTRQRRDQAADDRLPADEDEGSLAAGEAAGPFGSSVGEPGDVDPVAEADVHLAYGQDQQAEAILVDALQRTPTRQAIHSKLLDIYAQRGNTKAFDALATVLHGLTQGQGPAWEHASELGRTLSPGHPLYAAAAGQAPSVPGGPAAGSDMLSFDLSSIDLNLGPSGQPAEHPLETKLVLAEEFRAIGDLAGARSLAEEVLAQADGALKDKACAFLNQLA